MPLEKRISDILILLEKEKIDVCDMQTKITHDFTKIEIARLSISDGIALFALSMRVFFLVCNQQNGWLWVATKSFVTINRDDVGPLLQKKNGSVNREKYKP